MNKPPRVRTGRLARRLGLHFTAQFFMIWLSVLTTIFVALFVLMYYLSSDQLQTGTPEAILDSLSVETIVESGSVELPEAWPRQLQKRGYWLQIVDARGEIAYAANVPKDVPDRYSAARLLRIADTHRLGSYRMTTMYEDFYGQRSLYMLGQLDLNESKLQDWFTRYSESGRLRSSAEAEIGGEVQRLGASLRVLDENGRTVQKYGAEAKQNFEGEEALELVRIRSAPGTADTGLSYHYDTESGYTWLLESPRAEAESPRQPMLRLILTVSGIVGGAILLLTLALAAWHGYRYGGPLLLFMRGFERMGRGEYEHVFTDKERRKIFRKNGRFRARYKLYGEVIAGFSDMAGKLAGSRDERRRLEKSREEWMAGISHDLRTPLTSVQGYGHLLESGQFSWSEQELRDMGGTIREKSAYMLELLQDFSLTFELKNHTPGERLEPLELNEFVRRAVLRYVNDATLPGTSFGFEESGGPVTILANAKWFQRLLDNLISNAVKHNEPGTPITLSLRQAGNDAVIDVRDEGSGMDEQTQARLFDRYYRGTNTDEGVDGAGLGMSIAHAVVTAHKGTISVDSKPGRGTRITLVFPAAPDI
ncbi:sensor histidine kinase [Saccharibacillus brassicae]|uniref:histidine kinase n=1 Tax=Saccharibacillus brassicae TaxID=2583377 RepID=A0A4Y6V2C6_SACBS|nr:HAMP domain-containing sensor histidine kinase [Saccharibacillus brassicae]QDH22781.1 HAMP domain-containing histidine kinase [Saccharibacillus brassicae]